MKSEEAIVALKQGKKLRRPSWGSGYYVFMQNEKLLLVHTANDKATYDMSTNDLLPYTEFLKDDWELYED